MMAGLGALALRLLSQYLVQILAGLALGVLYFVWAGHQQSLGEERVKTAVAKRDAKTAEDSAKLMAEEKAKVELASKEQTERLQNAITIYATRTHNLSSDVDNLTSRLRNNSAKAGRCENTMPGASDDNSKGKSADNDANREIAQTIIELANLCEVQINKLPVKN